MSSLRTLSNSSEPKSKARIVIHGGAGNITHENLPPASRRLYLQSIANILHALSPLLTSGKINAVEAAVTAVKIMEDDPLFNCGRGAVFTLDGQNELEASLMVSRGYHKRCSGVFLLKHVKNPILLARELLSRDDPYVERGTQHNCLSGPYAEKLAQDWGQEMVQQDYFFTQKRWQQHLDDLKKKRRVNEFHDMVEDGQLHSGDNELPSYIEKEQKSTSNGSDEFNPNEYLPKGTVGCVALDVNGVIAVATSTGGLTNKVPGRIGDTPTPGAGFWAEEFGNSPSLVSGSSSRSEMSLKNRLTSCLPIPSSSSGPARVPKKSRAVGISGTGNGDYFLRLSACHNIASRCRFGGLSLNDAAKQVCGSDGEMERAGEGRGDFDGAVVGVDEEGTVVMEMNCGGCFRGTVDDKGRVLVAAYADEALEEWQTFKDVALC